MGRPPIWFTQIVTKSLKNMGYNCILSPQDKQADAIIIQHAQYLAETGKKVTVISCDYDFIALSGKAIHRILVPGTGVNQRSNLEVDKEEVLKTLNLTHNELFWAYCLSGCDDMVGNLNSIGFVKASTMVKTIGINKMNP